MSEYLTGKERENNQGVQIKHKLLQAITVLDDQLRLFEMQIRLLKDRMACRGGIFDENPRRSSADTSTTTRIDTSTMSGVDTSTTR